MGCGSIGRGAGEISALLRGAGRWARGAGRPPPPARRLGAPKVGEDSETRWDLFGDDHVDGDNSINRKKNASTCPQSKAWE